MAMRAALLAKKNAQAKNSNADYGQRLLSNDSGRSSSSAPHLELKGGNNRVSFASYNPPGADSEQPYQPMNDNPMVAKQSSSSAAAPIKKQIQEKYKWDFCIVVPNPYFDGNSEIFKNRNQNQETYESIMERLHLAGLQTYAFQSGDGDEIFIKVRASLERLQQHADVTELQVLMDPIYLKERVDSQKEGKIRDDPEVTSLTPYQFIYGKYQKGKVPYIIIFMTAALTDSIPHLL